MCSRIYARTAGNASFFIFFLGVPPGGLLRAALPLRQSLRPLHGLRAVPAPSAPPSASLTQVGAVAEDCHAVAEQAQPAPYRSPAPWPDPKNRGAFHTFCPCHNGFHSTGPSIRLATQAYSGTGGGAAQTYSGTGQVF
ncbi:MAG: hypothetical protein N2050_06150 [Flavobacteriales bacterium]|nr:hypothetical protein [Flavobacteriales bacterium]